MFTLLLRDVEVKAHVRDDPRELEKIKWMQIDKNFDNWLSAYTIYMAVVVVLQAYPGQGSALEKYQDLIHGAYREYSGAALLRYDEHCCGIGSTINSGHNAWAPMCSMSAITVMMRKTLSYCPGQNCPSFSLVSEKKAGYQ
ncbi:UNVERIFIED_CONTAM: hypothetical protein K2H54_004611 [Gekko kuhli]